MSSLYSNARTWAEMIKLSHSVFALPFALLATFLAAQPGRPSVLQFALIVLCMVGARSAAMTFNRIIDARFDADNPRTANRPIPRGQIDRGSAWLFFAAACGLFGASAGGFYWFEGNAWPLALTVPVLAWLCGYSYAKRFTASSHVLLGIGIAFAPVAAWIAIRPETLGPPAWLLMLAVTCWVAGFDLIYACQDVGFDRSAGLYSVPARYGVPTALWLARGLHVVTVAALLGVGWTAKLGWPYFIGVGLAAVLLTVENAIVSPRDLTRVNLAFFTVNGIVGVLLGLLGILDIVAL